MASYEFNLNPERARGLPVFAGGAPVSVSFRLDRFPRPGDGAGIVAARSCLTSPSHGVGQGRAAAPKRTGRERLPHQIHRSRRYCPRGPS